MKKNEILCFIVANTFILSSCNLTNQTGRQIVGSKPVISADRKTVYYGLYPQTNVNSTSLLCSLDSLTTPESNGWYLYDGNYYAKVSAKDHYNSSFTPDYYTFDNGTVIKSGTAYWFKCEPISWNVLTNNDGEYYLVSSVLLDVHCYYNSTSNRVIDGQTVYPNNYKYSDIRTWLNEDFYNSAFALGNEYIQTTIVDNSASTTDYSNNEYACDNTEDKVFLPSYQDYHNSPDGFSRDCRTTDWARARGAHCSTKSKYLYNGYYCARSPYSEYSDYAWCVDDGGYLDKSYYVDHPIFSVRPAITIKIA